MGRRPVQVLKNMWSAATNASLHKRRLRLQWLHFGARSSASYPGAIDRSRADLPQADLGEEVTITEQLKAAYTQIGTMAAVMIIFSTNMLLARTKLDVRSDIEARRQIMNFYTLAWIVADVSFINCAIDCVVLKLAMNGVPGRVCAVRFADRRFGDVHDADFHVTGRVHERDRGHGSIYLRVTLGKPTAWPRWSSLVLSRSRSHAVWYR